MKVGDLAIPGGKVPCAPDLTAGTRAVIANKQDITRAMQNPVASGRGTMPDGRAAHIAAQPVVGLAGEIPELEPGHTVRPSGADAGIPEWVAPLSAVSMP